MKIAFLAPHLRVVGGVRHLLSLGNELVRRGHQVTYLVPASEPLRCGWMACLGRVEAIEENLRRPFDVVVFSDEPQWTWLDLFKQASLTVHYLLGFGTEYDKPGSYESLRCPVDLRLANSGWVADRVQETLGVRPPVVRPGVDPGIFHPVKVAKQYQVLTYGSTRPVKGTADVEEACRRLGVPLEKYEGKSLPQTQLAREYCKARVFAVGSHVEGFGLPGLEALACGVPLVTTDNGGCREYARHGETALMVPPRDPEAMARAIDSLLKDADLARRLRANGLKLAREEFSWSASAAQFDSIVTAALEDRRRLSLAIDRPSPDTAAEAHRRRRAAAVATYTRPVPAPAEASARQRAVASEQAKLTSIITLSWDQVHHTQRFVESVRGNTAVPYELIIVDNGSTEQTQQYVKQAADIALLNSENRGFARGMNQGAAAARGDYLVFINNDTAVPPEWLPRLIESANRLDGVGLVAPAVTAGGSFVTVRAEAHDVVREVLPFSLPPAAVCFLMPRRAFEEAGRWCEEYQLGGAEDVDLCFALWARGRRVLVDERVLIDHYSKGTASPKLEDWQQVWRRNRELLIDRWSGAEPVAVEDEELARLRTALQSEQDPERVRQLAGALLQLTQDRASEWAEERARLAAGVAQSWREAARQREVAVNLRRQLRAGLWKHCYRLYLRPLLGKRARG